MLNEHAWPTDTSETLNQLEVKLKCETTLATCANPINFSWTWNFLRFSRIRVGLLKCNVSIRRTVMSQVTCSFSHAVKNQKKKRTLTAHGQIRQSSITQQHQRAIRTITLSVALNLSFSSPIIGFQGNRRETL